MAQLLDTLLVAFTTLTPATVAGALGVTANCVWPLLGSRRRILGVQVLSSIMFGLHFTLLGAHTAAAMCVAGGLQGVAASMLRRRWVRNTVFGLTIVGGLAITAATWSGLPSLLAQSGQLMSAFGRLQPGPQTIRLVFLGSEALWTAHNLLVGSAWGLVSDAMAVTMLLIGLWRGWARHSPPSVPRIAAV
jgi:hypothetical protein